jgi:hypothetical protein
MALPNVLCFTFRIATQDANRPKQSCSAEDAEEVKLSGVEEVFGMDYLANGALCARWFSFATLTRSVGRGTAMSRDLAVRVIGDYAPIHSMDEARAKESSFNCCERGFRSLPSTITPTIDQLRLIKSPREITMIEKSNSPFRTCIDGSDAFDRPRHLRIRIGCSRNTFPRDGAQGDAFYSLIASAQNAYWPHYNAGQRKMLDGDFLLMDYAPDVGYYGGRHAHVAGER